MRTYELNHQIGIVASDLDLFLSEEEMVTNEKLLRSVDDHKLGFTQVDHQLTKITKEGQGI